jgi:hypothetical protein
LERTERILNVFPDYYKTWDSDSRIFKVINAYGKRIDEAEKDLFSLLRAHWVDKAYNTDLDRLGAIYNMERNLGESDSEYRGRLKRAIMEFKGGGTISAILSSVKIALNLPTDYSLELNENPPKEIIKEFSFTTGDFFTISSESVLDAKPSIDISVETEDAEISNPTLTNTDTNEVITFMGTIKSEEHLKIEDGKAVLNDEDVTEKLSATTIPQLLRKGSTWSYTEIIEEEIGVFDVAQFDHSIFAFGIPTVKVVLNWTAFQPATFEISIPKNTLYRGNDISLVEAVVNSIKAVGVKAIINVIEG